MTQAVSDGLGMRVGRPDQLRLSAHRYPDLQSDPDGRDVRSLSLPLVQLKVLSLCLGCLPLVWVPGSNEAAALVPLCKSFTSFTAWMFLPPPGPGPAALLQDILSIPLIIFIASLWTLAQPTSFAR